MSEAVLSCIALYELCVSLCVCVCVDARSCLSTIKKLLGVSHSGRVIMC